MSDAAFVDFETRSVVDLRQTGVYPYAEHPLTDIWCMAWAIGDGPVNLWVPGSSRPDELEQHVLSGGILHAHNAQFERIVWREVLGPRYAFPVPRLDQWRCTAAECAAMSLPRALGDVCHVLPGLDFQKDDQGHRLMMQMAKPRSVEEDGSIIWWEEPDKQERLYAYCVTDVETERAIHSRIRRLSDEELRVYHLDQRMNDRGVHVDSALISGMQAVAAWGAEEANTRLQEITGDGTIVVTKPASLLEWVRGQGVDMADFTKASVRDTLAMDTSIPDDVREVLTIRQEAGKTSAAKLDKIQSYIANDGRVHGTLLYHGASTGRWSGQGPQFQNLPRPESKKPERMIPTLAAGNAARLRKAGIPPLQAVTDNLRGTLTAAPGHRLMAGDYSQIEARIVCWISGEEYGDYEYEKMAAATFGMTLEAVLALGKDSFERWVGKNTVLGCGFGMGPDKFGDQFFLQSGIKLDEELPDKAVKAFRESKPGIPRFWTEVNGAAMAAVQKPGLITHAGRNQCVKMVRRNGFLWVRLPSGRFISYADPQVKRRTRKFVEKDGTEKTWITTGVEAKSIDPNTRKWQTYHLYGGLWTENIVQAIARDLMASAMLRLEAAGYMPVLTVHDEIVCEVRNGLGDMEEFSALMSEVPSWLEGCLVKIEAWEGQRYRK